MEKAELKNYRVLLREVQQLKNQIRVLENSLYSLKGQQISDMPRAASGPKKTTEEAVVRSSETNSKLQALYRTQLAEKENRQAYIENAIMQSLDAPERVVMRARYIEGQGWPAIVRMMQKEGYSERTVYRLHGSALFKLKEC
jgi:hypothetical protein